MSNQGMVRFETNPERYNSVSMLKKLESNIREAIDLDSEVLAMDEEICLNSVFMSRNIPTIQTIRRNSDFEMVITLISSRIVMRNLLLPLHLNTFLE